MAITAEVYGLNGARVFRFYQAYFANVPVLSDYLNVIGPGYGTSRDALQAVRTAAPMGVITNETDNVAVVDPVVGAIGYLESPERGAQRRVSSKAVENALADNDALIKIAMTELGEAAALTYQYLFDYWLSEICYNGNVAAETGYSGGDGLSFFSATHPQYPGSGAVVNNNRAALDFNAVNIGSLIQQWMVLKDMKGNAVPEPRNILLVHGPSLWDRIRPWIVSELKPFEASNTPSLAQQGVSGMTFRSYNCARYTGTLQWAWSLYDLDAMRSINGSGLNLKVMRAPNIYADRSDDGRWYLYTNTLRAGIGAGTHLFGVGSVGTA